MILQVWSVSQCRLLICHQLFHLVNLKHSTQKLMGKKNAQGHKLCCIRRRVQSRYLQLIRIRPLGVPEALPDEVSGRIFANRHSGQVSNVFCPGKTCVLQEPCCPLSRNICIDCQIQNICSKAPLRWQIICRRQGSFLIHVSGNILQGSRCERTPACIYDLHGTGQN